MVPPPAGDVPGSVVADAGTALFIPDGRHLVPTELARGPWSPMALHGGPVAALAARAAEVHPGGAGMQLVRITLELLRPVPLTRLALTSSLVKPGRTTQLVDTVVEADGVEVAWSRALRILVAPEDQRAEPTVPEDAAPDPPDRVEATPMVIGDRTAFHNRGMELRFVNGRTNGRGPATVWFRLRCPVVLGEQPSPWQRVAAAADFGNGVAAELEFGSGSFINPDLTVSLHRPPAGEWICLDARTRFGTPGIGAAESALWDREGRIGRALQNLVVEVPS
jgi:acyl-coenzyme A thioesterase PaaI-like protein